MQDNIKNILGVSLALSSLVFSFSLLFLTNGFLQSRQPARVFAVSAEGEVVAVPDIAEFTLAVITEGGKDLAELQEENSTKANQVNGYLKDGGVAKDDIKTVSYNINPRYQHFPCPVGATVCPPSEIVGYTITLAVKVKVRELSKVGELLSGVVIFGANSTSALTFSIDDLEKVQSQARDIAIQKANMKAQEIAASAKVRLGKIVSISESFQTPFFLRESAQDFLAAQALQATPPVVEPGSQEVKANINIIYEIR
jgi:hypothetical protein